VRSVAGLLVSVGRGERPPPDVKRVLDARDRHASAPVAPPHGLTLTRVVYRPNPFSGR
jgi:tRNA pseudouridine38-40 synthase